MCVCVCVCVRVCVKSKGSILEDGVYTYNILCI